MSKAFGEDLDGVCTTQKALEHDKIAKKRGQNIGSSGREEAFTKKYTRKSNFGIFDIYLVMLSKWENLNFPPFFSVNQLKIVKFEFLGTF